MLEYDEILEKDQFVLYIYTSICATCNFARSMLKQIELTHDKEIFYQMNASYHEDFMMKYKVKSVPCLLIQKEGRQKKIYTFHSTANIYQHLLREVPELLLK